jgi:hypothetical protein
MTCEQQGGSEVARKHNTSQGVLLSHIRRLIAPDVALPLPLLPGDAASPSAGPPPPSPFLTSPVGVSSLMLGSPSGGLMSPRRPPRKIPRAPYKVRVAVLSLVCVCVCVCARTCV